MIHLSSCYGPGRILASQRHSQVAALRILNFLTLNNESEPENSSVPQKSGNIALPLPQLQVPRLALLQTQRTHTCSSELLNCSPPFKSSVLRGAPTRKALWPVARGPVLRVTDGREFRYSLISTEVRYSQPDPGSHSASALGTGKGGNCKAGASPKSFVGWGGPRT